MAKKFDSKTLNAVSYAMDTINEAIEKPAAITPIQPEVVAAESEKIEVPISEEKTAVSETPVEEVTDKPAQRKRKTKAASEADKDQKPIGVNVLVPPSVYKRMMNMKADNRKPLNQIGLEAIEKWLDKSGY